MQKSQFSVTSTFGKLTQKALKALSPKINKPKKKKKLGSKQINLFCSSNCKCEGVVRGLCNTFLLAWLLIALIKGLTALSNFQENNKKYCII